MAGPHDGSAALVHCGSIRCGQSDSIRRSVNRPRRLAHVPRTTPMPTGPPRNPASGRAVGEVEPTLLRFQLTLPTYFVPQYIATQTASIGGHLQRAAGFPEHVRLAHANHPLLRALICRPSRRIPGCLLLGLACQTLAPSPFALISSQSRITPGVGPTAVRRTP